MAPPKSTKAHGSDENAHSADRHSVEDGDQRRPDDCGKLGGFQFALYVEDIYNTFVCIYILRIIYIYIHIIFAIYV